MLFSQREALDLDNLYTILLGMPAGYLLLTSITGFLSNKSGRKSVPISKQARLLCLFLAILCASVYPNLGECLPPD